eukprot:276526_1
MSIHNLTNYLLRQHNITTIKHFYDWVTKNEYDTDALEQDIYECTYEELISTKLYSNDFKKKQSNIEEQTSEKQMFELIVQYADICHFVSSFIDEHCTWNNDDVTNKLIADCKTETLINLIDINIFNILDNTILVEYKQQIFHSFKHNKINGKKLNSMNQKTFCELLMKQCGNTIDITDALQTFYEDITQLIKNATNNLTNCSVIRRLSFVAFKHNQLHNIEQLVDIFNTSDYKISDLMNDIHHLFNHHQFMKNDSWYKMITDYIFKLLKFNICVNDDCESMKRHCRKYRRDETNKNDGTKNNRNYNGIENETWNILCDQLHAPLFHDKSTDFRNRYRKATQENNVQDNHKFPHLQFGVHVDQWLPFKSKPKFDNMEQEVMFNDYVCVSKDRLDQIKLEVRQRYVSWSNHQHLNCDELLSLKLFTDMDTLQKEFTMSFWNVAQYENKSKLIRRQQFYHWANTLRRAFKYGNVPIKQQVYRGLNKLLQIPSF